MFENLCSLVVLGAVASWAVVASRPRGAGGVVLPFVRHGPRRRMTWALPFWLAGPAVMIVGLFVIARPLSPSTSDCHGSPVCGLDGFDRLGDLIGGAVLVIAGVFVLIVVSIVVGVVNGRRRVTVSTPRVDRDQ